MQHLEEKNKDKTMEKDLIIEKYDIAIRVDESSKLIYAFELDLDDNVDESTKGILKHVDTDLAKEIADYFKINVINYGVEIVEQTVSFKLCEID
jgi:hypothetical protein